jgi:hypothetical protein
VLTWDNVLVTKGNVVYFRFDDDVELLLSESSHKIAVKEFYQNYKCLLSETKTVVFAVSKSEADCAAIGFHLVSYETVFRILFVCWIRRTEKIPKNSGDAV